MKQKSNEIKRLFQFMGKHRTLLNVSRFLSGISALFIMCPFLCVYFAARDLVSIFAGKPIDTGSLVKWGACIGTGWVAALLHSTAVFPCGGVPHREKPENGSIKGAFKNAYGVF